MTRCPNAARRARLGLLRLPGRRVQGHQLPARSTLFRGKSWQHLLHVAAMTTDRSSAARVRRRRDKLRAMGLRPVQIWVPDTNAPGFAAEAARQARLLAEWEASPAGRDEMAFWDALASEAWGAID